MLPTRCSPCLSLSGQSLPPRGPTSSRLVAHLGSAPPSQSFPGSGDGVGAGQPDAPGSGSPLVYRWPGHLHGHPHQPPVPAATGGSAAPLRLYPPGTMAWDPAAAETASLPLPEVGGAQPLALAGSPLPRVAVLIPAKNESAVLPRLLHSLTQLDYPSSHLELWAIDDASSDATPDILQEAQKRIPHLRVYRRPPGRGGGKSGALNEVLPLTRGRLSWSATPTPLCPRIC